jgi:hypothetical protein
MPTTELRSATTKDRTAFSLVRRAQASIASFLHFRDGDLSKLLDRDAFQVMAARLANHFFHKSKELAIHAQVEELYLSLLIMAPILQRLPLSCKFDWHRGHLLGFFRRNASGRVGRFHCAIREVERSYQPEMLAANLEAIGIHDADMTTVLLDQYRRHAGGTALKDQLAHQLFDPILMLSQKQGYELRHGNRLLRLERSRFEGSIDLRAQSVAVLDFSLKSVEHSGGRHLEISISDACLSGFRQQVGCVIASASSPAFKVAAVENLIRDLVERTRPARSALPQIQELRTWLAAKLRSLAGTSPAAKMLPNLLVNQWLQRSDFRLYLKSPSFFFNPSAIDEKTYLTFFSPYREV